MGAAAIPIAVGAQVIGGGLSAYGSIQSAKSESRYYNYLAGLSESNAKLAEAKGESDIHSVGAQEFQGIKDIHTKERETIGSQKTALVSGAGVGSKTGEQIVADTETKTNLDEMALRYNADVAKKNIKIGADTEAFNYRSQATGYRMAGKNAKTASKLNMYSSILGTGGSVASMFIKR